MTHIWVQILEMHAGCRVIVPIQHSTNYNNESCIWQLWDVTSQLIAHELSQIRRPSFVASPSLLPRLPNLTCTFLQKHLHPLSPNPSGNSEIFQRLPGLKSLQKICNRCRPAQGSISQLVQIVLSQNNRPMLLLEKPSHPYILPLVDGTNVGLPHPFDKLLQGEFRSLQANRGFAFSPAQVRQILALSICIEFVIRNIWQWGQIPNHCHICPARFRCWLKSFCWEANGRTPRCTGNLSVWSREGQCQPIDWMVSSRYWRHSRYAWR
jgi:hypothetical protein